MKQIFLGFIIIIGIIGVFLLGSSITGYIVSETCCFPPNCNPENQCRFGEAPQNDFSLLTKTLTSASILFTSILLYGLWHKKYRNSSVRKR